MNFAKEPITPALAEELRPLLELHYHEIAHYQDIPLNPAYTVYIELERQGSVACFTARDDTRRLVGYAVFFLKHNLHYQTSFQAVQDILFIDPKSRGFGMKFIDWCDRELKAMGVQVVYHHVKEKHNFGPLLERLSYKRVDHVYARRLD